MISMDEIENYEEFIVLLRDRSSRLHEGDTFCVDYMSQAIVATQPTATFGIQCNTIEQAKIVQIRRLLDRKDYTKNVRNGLVNELTKLSEKYPEYTL